MESVVIIGGGPAGLSAGIYLARAGLAPTIFAGSPPGGQLTLTSEVENYPGYESILGPELIEKMRKQAIKFGATIVDENVLKVDVASGRNALQCVSTSTQEYRSKSIIIATGAKALWLGVPGEERLRGKGVSACATCDGFFFKNKVVGVVGGGDTALEEALTLTKFAKHVIIIHRKNEFRASKIMQKRVFENPKIEVIWNAEVSEVLGEKRVEGVLLDIKREIKLDGLFVAIGHKPDTDLFKGKIELDENGYVMTTSRIALENLKFQISNLNSNLKFKIKNFNIDYQTATSVAGVFAVGDCVDHIYRQAATAVGMGVGGALDVERYLEEL